MLRCISGIKGYHVQAEDGEIGKVHDFYFDDSSWTVRHIVVNTGNWLDQRLVLVPPDKVQDLDWEDRRFKVALTQDQVEQSPGVDADQPVSRQQEEELHAYYGLTPYWANPAFIGAPVAPIHQEVPAADESESPAGDPHLRSVRAVDGYDIQANDGPIGHVEDFIVEDGTWIIRYLVVDTRNLLPGKKVLVAPAWVRRIDWPEHSVHIALERDQIKEGPAFDPDEPVNRQYEHRYYDYYGRPKYWENAAPIA